MGKARLVAFHLPQFHAIAENDEWWGKGFTEWTNVRKAKPFFRWHRQPHVPLDGNYYDLLEPGALRRQGELAIEYGVDAFCFYHYWFQGRRLLEKPVEAILASDEFPLPFCLCWANEAWTRTWDGGSRKVLMEQGYSTEDHRAHIRYLIRVFKDPRYLRMEGKPVLLVYRASLIPEVDAMLSLWREECRKEGIEEPYLLRVESQPAETGDPRPLGFDGAVEFQPDWRRIGWRIPQNWIVHWASRLLGRRLPAVLSYDKLMRLDRTKARPEWTSFPCVIPGWDNTPRRKERGVVFRGETPEKFGAWLSGSRKRAEELDVSEPLVFVNAWNEWAEGAHLEPGEDEGYGYLEQVRKVMRASPNS